MTVENVKFNDSIMALTYGINLELGVCASEMPELTASNRRVVNKTRTLK